MVYVDRPQRLTVRTDSNDDEKNKLLPTVYYPFRIMQVTEHTLTVDENDIGIIIWIARATATAETIERPRRFKASNTPSKEKQAL